MSRRKKIYEGKAKILYEGPEPGTLVQYFKDDATAFNAQKKAIIEGKGVLNNRISEFIMNNLNAVGVPTHFIKRLNMREQLIREVEIIPLEVVCRNAIGVPTHFIRTMNMREQLVRQVEIIPLEVVCRNVAAGSISQRFGIPEGAPLPRSIVEFYYKNDGLQDPMVSEEHITAFNWASTQEIDDMIALTLRINDYLFGMFSAVGIRLVDFKVEFGRLYEGDMVRTVLADEISPDCCRLWDVQSNERLDKDRFRRDLGDVVQGYAEVARRLGIMRESSNDVAAAGE